MSRFLALAALSVLASCGPESPPEPIVQAAGVVFLGLVYLAWHIGSAIERVRDAVRDLDGAKIHIGHRSAMLDVRVSHDEGRAPVQVQVVERKEPARHGRPGA
jgi:hypothetical protein